MLRQPTRLPLSRLAVMLVLLPSSRPVPPLEASPSLPLAPGTRLLYRPACPCAKALGWALGWPSYQGTRPVPGTITTDIRTPGLHSNTGSYKYEQIVNSGA